MRSISGLCARELQQHLPCSAVARASVGAPAIASERARSPAWDKGTTNGCMQFTTHHLIKSIMAKMYLLLFWHSCRAKRTRDCHRTELSASQHSSACIWKRSLALGVCVHPHKRFTLPLTISTEDNTLVDPHRAATQQCQAVLQQECLPACSATHLSACIQQPQDALSHASNSHWPSTAHCLSGQSTASVARCSRLGHHTASMRCYPDALHCRS